jgi:hypothetical protein
MLAKEIAQSLENVKISADADLWSKKCFDALLGKKITKMNYLELFNFAYDNYFNKPGILDSNERGSMNGRKDHRKLGEFALEIYDSTNRERMLMDGWGYMLKKKGLVESIEIIDNGMANDGMMLFSKDRLSKKADFRVVVKGSKLKEFGDGETLIETKCCPSMMYMHYKASDLKSYVKQGAHVVVFVCNQKGRFLGNPNWDFDITDLRPHTWGWFSNESMKKCIDTEESGTHFGVNGQPINGKKMEIRLNGQGQQSPLITDYITLYNWN